MKLKVGDKAPELNAKNQNGQTIKLSDFKGKKVVLYFYPRDMTPGCTAEACSLRDNYQHLLKSGYVVLGISTDNEKTHQKFIDKEKLPFDLLADTDKSIHSRYGTWVEKSMYGRKYMGTARVTFVLDEKGIIQEIIEKVDTKNHASQILHPAKEAAPENKKPALKKAGKTAEKQATTAKKPAKKTTSPTAKKKR